MRTIIGLNLYHADSSAALIQDGRVLGAIAEERLGDRVKHTSQFPLNAIKTLLSQHKIGLAEVDAIAIARDENANLNAKIKWSLKNLKKSVPAFMESKKREKNSKDIIDEMWVALEGVKNKIPPVIKVEHHLAHISSAYYTSNFKGEVLGISYDASGDFVSGCVAICSPQKISIQKKIHLPHSLGLFYTALCQFIGFDRFGEEYKVMGLAPYGQDLYAKEMEKILIDKKDGTYWLNPKYVAMHSGGQSGRVEATGDLHVDTIYKDKLSNLLGSPISRDNPDLIRQRNIARSTQVAFERCAINLIRTMAEKTGLQDLVLSGGSALNGVTNAKVLNETKIKNMHLHPAAGDDGTAVGAALFAYFKGRVYKPTIEPSNPYLGQSFTDEDVAHCLRSRPFKSSELEYDELIEQVAALIADGNVVGWYQGRSEWGPRALGNRSILADPANPNMKEIINTKIKRRESFRPFAPSVLDCKVKEYFKSDVQSPFMMHVVEFKDEWKVKLPAVCHVDGTGRLQSVSRDINTKYYDLITALGKKTGVYMVLNTSFNENEPIVETPQQALDCFSRTDMDYLVMNNRIISK